MELTNGIKLGFVYCRSTPNNPEVKAINKYFDECLALLGDFNLSHRNSNEQEKLETFCQGGKYSALKEITRTKDLVDFRFSDSSFEATMDDVIGMTHRKMILDHDI